MPSTSPTAPAGCRRFGAVALALVLITFSSQALGAPFVLSSGTNVHARGHEGVFTALLNEVSEDAKESQFIRRTFRDATGEHGYVVYVPPNYTPDRPWPVMLFLHGAGERGNDGVRQSMVGLGTMIRRWNSFPWIVVFPQAEDTRGPIKSVWSPDAPDGRRALAILDEVEQTYRIDTTRRVLTGWSMGGRGAYMLAAADPEKWSAVLPIAGWADLDLAGQLTGVPIWSFHGTDDELVAFDDDQALIDAIRSAGGSPFFTVMPGRGHYIWRTIYASPVVFEWMANPERFAGRKEPPMLEPVPGVEATHEEVMGPFVPQIEMHQVVAVRLGPDLFRDLSTLATRELAEKPLQGRVPGTSTQSQEGCLTFDVHTSRISYHVPIKRIEVRPTAQGTLLIRVAVENARLRIGRTDIRGILCSATAGPMHVVLGHRGPVCVEAEATPYICDGQFRLRTKSVQFSIPNDNWYVTRPVVESHCLFLPPMRVAQSLVEGVYANRGRLERDFRRSVANAIDEMVLELPSVTDDQLLTALWPVPAYRPRVKTRPEQVTVNEDGLAVVFGLTVAAVDPYGHPSAPTSLDFGLTADDVGQGDLSIAAAQGLIEPLTRQLIDAGLAHINVVDVPEDQFAHLADRNVLAEAIPALRDLPATAELRTELYLREPLRLSETQEPVQACDIHGCFTLFGLRVQNVAVVVSVRDSAESNWRDFAEFNHDVTQSIRLEVGEEHADGREVVSGPEDAPKIQTTAHWLTAPPADPTLDVAAATRLFRQGWMSWADPDRPTAMLVPDLELRGYVRRLDRLEPGPRGMVAVFEEPETIITNASESPFAYRMQRADGAWSSLFTLSPGERHVYRIPHVIELESESAGQLERYEIPPGRDAIFRSQDGELPRLIIEPLPEPLRRGESVPGTGS